MLICKEYGFAFIHIPRTGGNSVRETLAQQLAVPVIRKSAAQGLQKRVSDLVSPAAKAWLAGKVQGTPLRYYITTAGHPSAALLRLTVKDFRSLRTFSFVRNPYERVVSGYKNATGSGEFTADFGSYTEKCLRYIQPQVNFVSLNGKIIVDFVGRVERVQEDFDHICKWVGLEQYTLPVLSASPPGDYRDFLTPVTKQRIKALFEEDFSAFQYSM